MTLWRVTRAFFIAIKKPPPKQGASSKLFQLFNVAVVLVITMPRAIGLAVVFIGSSLT